VGLSAWVLGWSDAGGGEVGFEASCAGFFGGIDPDFAENVRARCVEGAAVARRQAVRERMAGCMS
jgi:hypothetical protein